MDQQRVKKKPEKKNGKGNQGLHKVNVSYAHINKNKHMNDKCYLCKKPGHY